MTLYCGNLLQLWQGTDNFLPQDNDYGHYSLLKQVVNSSCSVEMSRDALCVCHKHRIIYTEDLQVQPVTVVLSKEGWH